MKAKIFILLLIISSALSAQTYTLTSSSWNLSTYNGYVWTNTPKDYTRTVFKVNIDEKYINMSMSSAPPEYYSIEYCIHKANTMEVHTIKNSNHWVFIIQDDISFLTIKVQENQDKSSTFYLQ